MRLGVCTFSGEASTGLSHSLGYLEHFKKKTRVSRKPPNEHLVPSQNLAGQRWKTPLLVQGGAGGGAF